MFDINAALDKQIAEIQPTRPTVILTEPLDPRMAEAACYLARFAKLVFLAPEVAVRRVYRTHLPDMDPTRLEYTFANSTFVDVAERDDMLDEFVAECMKLPPERRRADNPIQARELLREPARFGIMSVRCGHADMVVGGMVHGPRDYFRPMLRLLQMNEVMCEAGVFVLPPEHPAGIFPRNIVVFGDVAVNAIITPEILAHIAVGTCAVARDIIPTDVLPTINGAIVSYSHRGSDEGPSADLVRRAAELIPGILAERIGHGERYATINIESEVKISYALSARSAMYYDHGDGEGLAGRTNVIIAPNLDMGNMLYHLYGTRFPAAKKFPAMFGVRFRGVDLAIDATAEDAMLAIKASILRLHRFGHWTMTPRDTFFPRHRILAVNPGSTSTKIAVFEGEVESFTKELQHSAAEMEPYEGKSIIEQYAFRQQAIEQALAEHGLGMGDIDALSARGGLLRPIPHGTYLVNERMRRDLHDGVGGEHASNLGALIAHELAAPRELPAFIVDPVVVDEVEEKAKITGFKCVRRQIISHALNQIATAQRYAEENETFYRYLNLIVCHMGGGITIGAHFKGRYIDVNNGLNGEGPFTPQRSGTIPTGQLIELCFSGKYSHEELKKLNKGRGGLIDLLGTSDMREVERRVAEGEPEATLVFDALAYQIAKHVTALLPAFDGEPVDRILLTGGMARGARLMALIEKAVAAVGCGVTVYPGENEMYALAKGALRVLGGKEKARTYEPEA